MLVGLAVGRIDVDGRLRHGRDSDRRSPGRRIDSRIGRGCSRDSRFASAFPPRRGTFGLSIESDGQLADDGRERRAGQLSVGADKGSLCSAQFIVHRPDFADAEQSYSQISKLATQPSRCAASPPTDADSDSFSSQKVRHRPRSWKYGDA